MLGDRRCRGEGWEFSPDVGPALGNAPRHGASNHLESCSPRSAQQWYGACDCLDLEDL